jgi:bifunctional DNA-binding transcriptional regulator/antitoxin component of YhaV-PrlF toxin-antitoxin module
VAPVSIQRRAGIKNGDRLKFRVPSGAIAIAPAKPATYKATKSEMAAIRNGQAAVARDESVDRNRRQAGATTTREVSR